ncbi:MAG: hypothetical protein HY764_00620 [Candidatus Portnoybacteria bacterium]|nr:hypothetical protein [Candidatus Portnoybacteria bacterium]
MYDETLAKDYILIPQGIFCKLLPKFINRKRILEELKKYPQNFLIRNIKDNDMIFKNPMWVLQVIVNCLASYDIQGSIYCQHLRRYEESISKYKKAMEIEINGRIYCFVPFGNFYQDFLNKYKESMKLIKDHYSYVYEKKLNIINKQKEEYKNGKKGY